MPPVSEPRLDRLITRLAGWAVGVFHRVECVGEPIPDGPVLVTANHPNSLLDPLVVFRVAGRGTRPLAKAPLFEQAIMGTVLRALGGLPVYRRQDDPSLMHRNDETFAAAIAALRAGDAIQIYPEGRSHSEPSLAPLRTGASRIALAAESDSDWKLRLRIVPVGLTYRRKHLFRGRVLAVLGEPFEIAGYRALHESDPAAAVRALTDEIADRLERVTLGLANYEDLELIETADRLYAREKGVRRWRERETMADRMPRLRFFARGLAWLRASDPTRHVRLTAAVRRYQHALALFGAAEADVPPQYETGAVIRYGLREAVSLLIGLPLAALGAALWLPAYYAPRAVVSIVRPEFEAVATWKLATGFFTVPFTVVVVTGAAWLVSGPWVALAVAIVAPLAGLATIAWYERWRRVREDAVVYFRVLRHRRGADRLASLRTSLTAEFDDILDDIPSEDAGTSGRDRPADG